MKKISTFFLLFSFVSFSQTVLEEDFSKTEAENGIYWNSASNSTDNIDLVRSSEGVSLTISVTTAYQPSAIIEFGENTLIDISGDQSYSFSLTNNGDLDIVVRLYPEDDAGNSVMALVENEEIEPWWYIVEDTVAAGEVLNVNCASWENMVDIDWSSPNFETTDLMDRTKIKRLVLTIVNLDGHANAQPLPLEDFPVMITSLKIGESVCPDTDMDGVPDAQDNCPNTSLGDPVDENGCSDAQKNIVSIKTGQATFTVNNPITDQIVINTSSEIYTTYLYGIEGEQVASGTTEYIDSSNLPSGLYILEVLTSSGKEVVKLIKE